MKTKGATCRNCGLQLKGEEYFKGSTAYHPETGERCPLNFYGGFVCSPKCDVEACLELSSNIPGAGLATRLSGSEQAKVNENWPEY